MAKINVDKFISNGLLKIIVKPNSNKNELMGYDDNKKGIKVNMSTTKNGWLEFDTIKDYEIYTNLKEKNMLNDIIKLE